MRNLSGIRSTIRQLLRDEFSSPGVALDWLDEELDTYIQQVVAELSEHSPYQVKETLAATANSKDLNISPIGNLLFIEKAEFRVDKTPRQFRNVSRWGNILTLDISFNPGAGESVYLYCNKVHELDEVSSTLTPEMERLLVIGSVAYAALGWVNKLRGQITEAISKISSIDTEIGKMTARITQAIADLATGRNLINQISVVFQPGDYANYAARELSTAMTYLNQAGGHSRTLVSRLSISSAINTYQNWAVSQLALYKAGLSRINRPRTTQEYPKN